MIYFIQSNERAYSSTKRRRTSRAFSNGPIKIGHTEDTSLKERVDNLQTGCPYPLVVLGVIANGTREEEQLLHYKFRNYRLMREWFSAHKTLLTYIKNNSTGYLLGKTTVE
jgi:Meiotically up-regulated gene 113